MEKTRSCPRPLLLKPPFSSHYCAYKRPVFSSTPPYTLPHSTMSPATLTRKSSRSKVQPVTNGKARADSKPPAAKGKANGARKKRPATPEAEDETDEASQQPSKRARASLERSGSGSTDEEVREINNGLKQAALETKKGPAGRKRKAAEKSSEDETKAGTKNTAPKKTAHTINNPLPTPAEHTRPANQLFVWGAGNFGQFGMGPEHLNEFDKPKKNTWIEKKMEEGIFGGEGAGIEAIAAGGLHTMFIDEKGTVSRMSTSPKHDIDFISDMVLWCQ